MILKCMENYVIFLKILTVLLYYFSYVQCNENNRENRGTTLRNSFMHSFFVGEPCDNKICSTNEYCDEDYVCQCRPGFKNYAGHCLQCSEEYEICTVKLDCCPMLICFGGVCRKGFEPIEFFTIFKICLGITIVSVIVVIFALLLRGLLNVKCTRWFRRNEPANANSQQPYMPQFRSPRSLSQETIEEKPPSYEECIKSSRSMIESPPPYVISTNVSVEHDNVQSTNDASINPSDTTINIQTLKFTKDVCLNPALHSDEKFLQSQRNII